MVASGPSMLNVNRSSCTISSGLQKWGAFQRCQLFRRHWRQHCSGDALSTRGLETRAKLWNSDGCGMCTGG